MSGLNQRVRSSVAVFIIALAMVIFGCLGAGRYRGLVKEPGFVVGSARVDLTNIYMDTLTEPFEVCLFVFVDGSMFTLTTQEEEGISLQRSLVIEMLETIGPISDILTVVHSHPRPGVFSIADNAFYAALKERGFRGVFGIYCSIARTITVKSDLEWGKR